MNPAAVISSVAITGMQSGETLVGIDYSPSSQVLFGIGTTSRLYTLNPTTGAATPVGAGFSPALSGTAFGVDSVPNTVFLRVVSNTEQNRRLNQNTGESAVNDTALSPAGNVVAIAYSNNVPGAAQNTLYGIDSVSGNLVLIGSVNGTPNSPNGGVVTIVGSLGLGGNLSQDIGLDIAANGVAYATITTGNPLRSRLYTINLSTGAATLVGNIDNGTVPFSSVTAVVGPIVVTNTNDSGVGSLRQAILDANASVTLADVIHFNIPGAGPHVIAPTSPLPPITNRVTIDGTSEPSFNPLTLAPVVVLDGIAAGAGATGLEASGNSASQTLIRGLQIVRFTKSGITIDGASVCRVSGCYIGTDGTNDLGNGTGPADGGVRIIGDASNSIIGGAFGADGNVISGNAGSNVRIVGAGTTATKVQGNIIGANAAGTAAIDPGANLATIGILGFATDQLGIGLNNGNLISGHLYGVYLLNSTNTTVSSNYIGLNENGDGAIPNTVGIQIEGESNFFIGSVSATAGNIISGNQTGIRVTNAATNGLIAANRIGTNQSGSSAVANTTGILLEGNSSNISVGHAGIGNLISGNTAGLVLRQTTNNQVRWNMIGTASNGTSALGNTGAGIRLESDGSAVTTSQNVIGSPSAGDPTGGNSIAFNGGAGVVVVGPKTFNNAIRANSIYSNGGLGIDLNDDGVTANDAGDADQGANQLQNYPVLSAAKNNTSGVTTIQGTFNGAPQTQYTIDFYTSDAADPSGHGEGRALLATLLLVTEADGNKAFNITSAAMAGRILSATATDNSGNTSEFSAGIPIVGPVPARLANIATRLKVETGDRVLIGGFIIDGNAPKKVIVRAIGPSAQVGGVLADPALEIYDSGNQLVASNNNWRENGNAQEISDSTLAPPNDLEAAFLGTLPAGAYTAVVYGVGETTGTGLVEVYDLDQAASSRLANIATRGFVQTGDGVLIGGLIITGETQLKLLLRGIGPSLTIDGKLVDPTLELFNANGDALAFNNNWRDNQEADIGATGIPPNDDLESAILTTLAPADYTAVLRGVNDTTGIGVVEIYALAP